MVDVIGDIVAPRVLIVHGQSPCPTVSGNWIAGMLCVSGGKLFIADQAGTWTCVGAQTA